ncbi:MAG: MBL fold metallo-hydrolase [Candidatus Peregrinibacteria bacterium]
MKIHFSGAAHEVTGSKHLLEINGKFILLDCGLFQGKRQEAYEKNKAFPFDPQIIDAMVLSHAHLDHCGNLPTLVKKGYHGRIFCTEATADILPLMLADSAHIQEQDEKFVGRHCKNLKVPNDPLYTMKDAEAVTPLLTGKPYRTPFEVLPGITVEFYDAGHILGSSSVYITFEEKGKKRSFLFTGDIGRIQKNILKDPETPESAEIIITESTYGDRKHEAVSELRTELEKIITDTAAKGGKIIIPAFSLQRTQEIIYDLHILEKENRIPKMPIFVDSPLATNVTDLYIKHKECCDQESYDDFLSHGEAILFFEQLKYTRTVDESKAIKDVVGPAIIISASGMCEGGRIRHHLLNEASNPKNTILIIGYQAEYTLGRRIVERRPVIKIFDEYIKLRADVKVLNGYSGHAGADELDAFLDRITGVKNVFVVHGEPAQSFAFAKRLRAKTEKKWTIEVPEAGDIIDPDDILFFEEVL